MRVSAPLILLQMDDQAVRYPVFFSFRQFASFVYQPGNFTNQVACSSEDGSQDFITSAIDPQQSVLLYSCMYLLCLGYFQKIFRLVQYITYKCNTYPCRYNLRPNIPKTQYLHLALSSAAAPTIPAQSRDQCAASPTLPLHRPAPVFISFLSIAFASKSKFPLFYYLGKHI